ncbi:MAG: FAD:protein FMN transferase [Eubacterium aggregans]
MKQSQNNMGIGVGLTLILLLVLGGCASQKVTTRSDFALDTVITMTLYGSEDSSLMDGPFQSIRDWDKKLNAYSTDNEIGAINGAAGMEPVSVSPETYDLIKKGLTYSTLTDGAFDITIGPLVDLWGIGEPETREPPSAEAIAQALALVDYKKVVLDSDSHSVYLSEPGMKLNLGAIAKGFIGEEARADLQSEGVEHAILNLGGNVVLIGGKTNGQDFVVGVEDPEDKGSTPLGSIRTKDMAVVTSGDYERYFTDATGVRYHHILSAKTGHPADSSLHQVTVVCADSTQADALTTSLFLMGTDFAKDYIEKNDGVEGILVTTDNTIWVSSGLVDSFVFDEGNKGDQYQYHLEKK